MFSKNIKMTFLKLFFVFCFENYKMIEKIMFVSFILFSENSCKKWSSKNSTIQVHSFP